MAKTIKGGASSSTGRAKAAPAPALSGLRVWDFKNIDDPEMQADYNGALGSLTKAETNAVDDYTGSGYAALNKMLREEGFDPAKFPTSMKTKFVNNLDSALAKGTLTKNIVAHRGFSAKQIEEGLNTGSIVKGTSITDPGFMSTSIKAGGEFGGNIKYKLYIPKGTKGLYVRKLGVSSEYEFLLPRNTTVVVRSIKKNGWGQWQLEVEVVP
jgi:hypothetical protein